MNDLYTRLHSRLQSLQPTYLVLEDDSARHAGHAGAAQGSHFNVHIVSAAFVGKTALQRHRMVYEAVGDLLQQGVHALGIRAETPAEWQQK